MIAAILFGWGVSGLAAWLFATRDGIMAMDIPMIPVAIALGPLAWICLGYSNDGETK